MADTLHSLLENRAASSPESIALRAIAGEGVTYSEALRRMRGIAAVLARMGIERGDRVAIVLPNGLDAALAFLGVAARATAAQLNPAYGRKEFSFYLEDLQAKLLLVDAATSPAAVGAATALGIRVASFASVAAEALAAKDAQTALAQPEDVALVLHTSGTTARPKIVPLTHANLTASARNIAASLELGPADRCLNVMPLFHIHGLVGAVLASLEAGSSVICSPGFDAEAFPGWLGSLEPTWFTAVPTMHQAIIAAFQAGATVPGGARLRFARSCSSALPPKVLADFEAALSVPLVEAYGMTEASHQMACNPLPPRLRKPGSVGLPTGVDVAVMDEKGQLLPRGATGEVVIRGPNVTAGYASPVEANATAFTEGWFRTGDQGRLDDDGYLFLTGRLKEIINRGGEKVSPREIDEVLLDHPAVAQAVAFAVPHPTLGEDLAAAVVLRPGAGATAEDIRSHAFSKLADFKVPSAIVIVDAIPKGPTGKIQRIGLAEKLAERLGGRHIAPRDDFEALVADIWNEVLARDGIGIDDNFFAIGGDSLRGMRVMSRINELFATEMKVTALFRKPTVAQLTAAVMAEAEPARVEEIMARIAELGSPPDAEHAGPAKVETLRAR